jgi:hypothetical protein
LYDIHYKEKNQKHLAFKTEIKIVENYFKIEKPDEDNDSSFDNANMVNIESINNSFKSSDLILEQNRSKNDTQPKFITDKTQENECKEETKTGDELNDRHSISQILCEKNKHYCEIDNFGDKFRLLF